MWINFVSVMTAPRLGWMSIVGICAVMLLCNAALGYASGTHGMIDLFVLALINLATVTFDYRNNA